MTSFEEVCHTR